MSPQPSLREIVIEDLAVNWRHRGRSDRPDSPMDVARSLGDVRFLPVLLIRLAQSAATRRSFVGRVLARGLALLNRLVFGVEVAQQSEIGPGLYFPHTGGIVIGATSIGARCVIYHQVTLGAKTIDMPFTPDLRPVVGDDVVVAAGAKVLGGVSLGDRSVVGANAVVVADVPADTVVVGVPARPTT